ncbi:hypothetical protein TARUN_4888 [Trichoderma arundinaceum]|uniref:Uncharacterized protein n=1 Tax=Trichoderma arundinaceum TaxID=490622 RepID=A0A395NMQ3_TRIAR|nr:hypothetical protein TARUN_4888 [Trichoderma arundinaceum]
MGSYINSTDPTPFDQIIVISQKVINESFQNMWELAQLDDAASPLKHFERSVRGGDYLKTDIGAPSVQLQVTTKDPMLYFMLRMTSGSLLLYLTNNPDDDSHIQWDIDNWVFAFSVTISRKYIDKNSAEYKQFKDRAGLPNWDFSLARLFIDASSTTKWNPDLSNFGDRQQDFKNLPTPARATFETFIQTWLNAMNDDGCDILGYSAQASQDTSDQYQPTFPPTSIDYDTYPWRDTPTSQDQNNIDSNGLCYLMMSNFISPASKSISYSGQYVDVTNHDATYVLNRGLFWPWMFTVLRNVVVSMVPFPDTPILYWDNSDPSHPYAGGMGYHFGDYEAGVKDYQFVSSGPGQWSWVGRPLTSSKQVYNPGNSGDSETIHEWTNIITPTTPVNPSGGTLTFTAGSEQITLTGKSSFVFRVDHDTGKRNKYTLMTFVLNWTIGIAMASVEDGGVVFRISSTAVNCNATSEGNLSWNPPADVVASEFKSQMTSSLSSAVGKAEADLMNALANQHRLFLPAKGSFLMRDPVFSSKGDLMVGLTYNGADPPKPQ